MSVKITKQIKQDDGTTITIEGTESEVEAFEKKLERKKSSRQHDESLKSKKTILHGKDLAEIAKIVKEAIEADRLAHPRITFVNYPQNVPMWIPTSPQITPQPGWYELTCNGNNVYHTESSVHNTCNPDWTLGMGLLTNTTCKV